MANCSTCLAFEADLPTLKRRVGLRISDAVPTLIERILAVDPSTTSLLASHRVPFHQKRARSAPRVTKAAQLVAAVMPLAFALPFLALGVFSHVHIVPAHVAGPCTVLLSHHFSVR